MSDWHAVDLQRYVRSLDGAAADTAVVVARLATAWADEAGREWGERLRVVGRVLEDTARAAADLVGDSDRDSVTEGPRAEEPAGVVLGAQIGARTSGRRGVVVPTLPAPR